MARTTAADTALCTPSLEQLPQEGDVSTANAIASKLALELSSTRKAGPVLLENGDTIVENNEPRQPEDEPQILEMVHESESESEREVELVLVNGELVQVQQIPCKRSEKNGEQVAEQKQEHPRGQEQEQKQEPENQHGGHDQEPNENHNRRHGAGPYAAVELPSDEELMRTVVAHASQLALALRKRPVWETIASACGSSRFPNGVSAQSRVQWLQSVWRDPSHRMHAHLTSELCDLLDQYRQARENGPQRVALQRVADVVVEEEEPPTKRLRLSTRQRQQNSQHQQQQEQTNETEQEQDHDDASTLLEEQTMAVVVKYASQLVAAEHKLAVWDAIARDCQHAGGKTNGSRIKSRTAWLCKVLLTPAHAKHATLSPRMRKLLRQFLAHDPWTKSRNAASSRIAKPGKEEEEVDDDDTPTPTTTRQRGKAAPWKTVQAPMDELLMALVLEKRPFAMDGLKKQQTWVEITRALKTPRITSGMGCQGRLRWLLFVYENKAHDQHSKLTPALRKSLAKYLKVYAPFQAETYYARQRRELQADGLSEEMAPSEQEQDDEEQDNEASEDDLRATRKEEEPREEEEEARDEKTDKESMNEAATPTVVEPTARENEALLREILRVRPFHARNGRSAAQWDVVAAELQSELGSATVFPTGLACLYQMRRLLRAVRHPERSTRVVVRTAEMPRIQVEMLTLIDTLLQMSWPTTRGAYVTNRHRSLAIEIEDMLRKTRSLVAHDSQEDTAEASAQTNGPRGPRGEPTVHSRVPSLRVRVDCRRMLPRPQSSVVTPPPPLCKPTRCSPIQDDDDATILETEPVDPQTSLAAQLKALQSEVATCRAQLTLQGSKSEHERQEHRAELRAMMELLVSERETHKHETQAMLVMLQQEQRDRRDEFTAMLKLIPQSK